MPPSTERPSVPTKVPSSWLRRLHAWVVEPAVPLHDDARELYAVTMYGVLSGLSAYVLYIPLFVALGANVIAAANVVVIVAFAWAVRNVRRGHVFAGMTLASIAVAAHAWLAALTLGADAGFQLHVVVALELGLLFTYVPLHTRLVFAAGLIAAFLGLVFTLTRTPPSVVLSPTAELMFLLLNSAIFAGLTVAIATIYAATVRRSQEARDRILTDLAERNETLRAAHQELARARDEAQEASRTKSMFLANMSHELRTPLNAIIGYSEMIGEEADEDGNEHLVAEVGRIMGAGRHLLALINDILDIAKIEAKQMSCERVDFAISDVVHDVLETLETLATTRRNTLQSRVAPQLSRLRTDPTKVRQILFNLLANACKFTEDGTITLTVEAEVRNGTDGVRIEVADTGIGIPADKLDHIFAEFSQADSTTTRRYGGTGLGLAISRSFAVMLGGTIAVASEQGRGSTFTVWLPNLLSVDVETDHPTEQEDGDANDHDRKRRLDQDIHAERPAPDAGAGSRRHQA